MTPQIRLNQFINAIVIGVLFQVLILFFASATFKFDPVTLMSSFDSSLIISGAIILSFPAWRLISNFVGFILEPVSNKKTFKNIYIKLFFGIRTENEEGRVQLLKKIIYSNTSYTNWQKKLIETYFDIELNKLPDEELYNIFEVIKATVNNSPSEYQGQQSEQKSLVSNFHARLAVLSNLGFWLSIITIIINSFTVTQYYWYNYLISAFCFYIFGMHFGLSTDRNNEGYRLVIADFMAILTKQKLRNK